MKKVKCPKCGEDVKIDISKSVDENGEVFQCDKCKYKLRYTEK